MEIQHIELPYLFAGLIVLFLISAFFSSSETALMAIDRHRLRHLSEKGHEGAKKAELLLQKPDRLIGLILLGNNFVNILITQLATIIGFELWGNAGLALTTGFLTIFLLIFAEVTPKTFAATKPEGIAFFSSRIYKPMLKVTYPIVWLINAVSNSLLHLVNAHPHKVDEATLGSEELRSIVSSTQSQSNLDPRDMLLSVLDLESATVEDIMIPRNTVSGIDLDDDWNEIEEQLFRSNFTRLLVYRGNLDNIIGFIHLRKVLSAFKEGKLNLELLEKSVAPCYFVLEKTRLTQQLINFQQEKRRIAMVVDEYGDIQGLITLEDILEEIVGEFSTSPSSHTKEIHFKPDGKAWMEGSTHVRDINKALNINLPTDGPKTINGLILEYLQSIPVPGLCMLINGYPMEIRTTRKNAVKTVLIDPHYQHNNDG